jgi:para-aminobenzoate synthetase component 1
MHWQKQRTIAWDDPLRIAQRYAGYDMALLYSSMHDQFSGNKSYLLLEPQQVVAGNQWSDMPVMGQHDTDLPEWVGYLSYALGAPTSSPSFIDLPRMHWVCYGHLLRFDHQQQTIEWFSRSDATLLEKPGAAESSPVNISRLASNFTRARYEQCVNKTVARIHAGDFYQANITRKFFGTFEENPNSWQMFAQLCARSPSPYSAYIRHGEVSILSSSPECFLSVDATGKIITRPIKGSARRSDNPEHDAQIQKTLLASEKNHAENLMIVDLMRNDLSRVSLPKSVTVTEQSALYSYATIHHLISTIEAQKTPDATLEDVIKASFPPGSMTGAPKIAAMQWCAAQEALDRGVYSGAIGWIGDNHRCDLSVVIRTLILQGDRFEFQVGGGIVADSTAEDEWRETLTKARAVASVLGLSEDDLASV